jgi:hypothetical protein
MIDLNKYYVSTEYQGASGGSEGRSGFVPKALSGEDLKFLRGDGTWQAATDVPTVINYLSTNNVLISALKITNAFSGINSLSITGNISGNNLRASFNQGSATGDYSFAEGISTIASGGSSHAEGDSTIASGSQSHAEGVGTIASGNPSHAEGGDTVASGDHSHAEGVGTTASGQASHAEGSYTTASGYASYAEGDRTMAAGYASHAAGYRATAAQDYTYAWSDGNLGDNSTNISTTRTGQYMVSASGGMFIPGKVGIGTDSIANALTVVGNISAKGIVYIANDIEITDSTKGIILRSLNGNRWRITITNSGTLSSVQL